MSNNIQENKSTQKGTTFIDALGNHRNQNLISDIVVIF